MYKFEGRTSTHYSGHPFAVNTIRDSISNRESLEEMWFWCQAVYGMQLDVRIPIAVLRCVRGGIDQGFHWTITIWLSGEIFRELLIHVWNWTGLSQVSSSLTSVKRGLNTVICSGVSWFRRHSLKGESKPRTQTPWRNFHISISPDMSWAKIAL